MRICGVRIENFGPFQILQETRIGNMTTLIGQNDVGKSHILKALDIFLTGTDLQEGNVCTASKDQDVVIEVIFDELPESVELEDGVPTSFGEEHLVCQDGRLRVRKRFPRTDLKKPETTLSTYDFQDDRYAGLPLLKEQELNRRCGDLGITAPRSGAGITNKSKRDSIRNAALRQSIPKETRDLRLGRSDNVQKILNAVLPAFIFFRADTPLGVGQTAFQGWFKPFIDDACREAKESGIMQGFESKMRDMLQTEVQEIHERLRRHTDAFTGLSAKPSFQWDKAVKVDVSGTDTHGTETLLENRGSGMQRLFMVSYFEYVAEKKREGSKDIVYGIEEPENCLHPGFQRELVSSFRSLVEEGFQIIVTSHSPVFAGASPLEDLTLVARDGGIAYSVQYPELLLETVASELGIGPSDHLIGYMAILFLEGPADESFFREVASKLKSAGHLAKDFNDVKLGIVITGGDNIKHWVDRKVMKQLNPRFCVLIDSDKANAADPIAAKKLRWKSDCERDGGTFLILRKRAIENYVHANALARRSIPFSSYDAFTDMKRHIGRKDVWKTIYDMTPDEILSMDKYEEGGTEHHELKELIESVLSMI